jgi:hypothetical protein
MAKGRGKYTTTDQQGYDAMQEARKQGEKNLSMAPKGPQKVTDGLEKMLQHVNDHARHSSKQWKSK